jgi:hypothetical protein
MRGSRTLVEWGFGACLAVAGCVQPGSLDTADRGPEAPAFRAAAAEAPELRIRGDALARSPDIPVVPVPPPPLGRGGSATPPPPPPSAPGSARAPAPAAPEARAPAPSAEPTPPAAKTARELYQRAAAQYAKMDSYIARLTRREYVKDKPRPEEVMLFKFRKAPWSVYFKWLGREGQGREVVYVKGRYENKIHSLLAAGDVPLMPAGKRMAVAPDNAFVRAASRHPITEAGIGACVEGIGRVLAAVERGDRRAGTLSVVAAQNRPEFNKPVPALEHVIPPGYDANLPRGGRRLYGFDPESGLPVLVITRDERGREVEYYLYDRLQYPVRLDDDDFDPDKLWSRPKSGAGRR